MNLFDTANYPTTEPATLVAGDTWVWKRTDLTDYPTSEYALSYEARLEGDGTDSISISASESGTDYLVTVAAATTAAYTVGTWRWDAYITRSSDSARVRIGSGVWEVKPDRANSTADPRSHVKIVLDAIEATLEGRATASTLDVLGAATGDRNITRDKDALRALRKDYMAQYQVELARERGQSGWPFATIQSSFCDG